MKSPPARSSRQRFTAPLLMFFGFAWRRFCAFSVFPSFWPLLLISLIGRQAPHECPRPAAYHRLGLRYSPCGTLPVSLLGGEPLSQGGSPGWTGESTLPISAPRGAGRLAGTQRAEFACFPLCVLGARVPFRSISPRSRPKRESGRQGGTSYIDPPIIDD